MFKRILLTLICICLPFTAVAGKGNATGINVDRSDYYATSAAYDSETAETKAFAINPGLNGSWFNPATTGQGFFLEVFPDIPLVFIAWFTYDTTQPESTQFTRADFTMEKILAAQVGDDNHRWITAQGPFDGDTANLEVTLTTGGLFDDPTPVTNTPEGTMTLTFQNCSSGTVEYNFTAAQVSGTVPLSRIADDNVALCQALNGNNTDLEDRVVALEAQVSLLLDLLAGVSRFDDSNGYDTLVFSGMNVQVVNGTGTTDGIPDGMGNLIIGYNRLRGDTGCPNDLDCNRRTGSHNLVIGAEANYASYGGIVAGVANETSNSYASITGGRENLARGIESSVSGGRKNLASGKLSSVSGGRKNLASGTESSVSGGESNIASGVQSSVSGGDENEASGIESSVSGGFGNVASGENSSVSGGFEKNANASLCWEGDTTEDC